MQATVNVAVAWIPAGCVDRLTIKKYAPKCRRQIEQFIGGYCVSFSPRPR